MTLKKIQIDCHHGQQARGQNESCRSPKSTAAPAPLGTTTTTTTATKATTTVSAAGSIAATSDKTTTTKAVATPNATTSQSTIDFNPTVGIEALLAFVGEELSPLYLSRGSGN